MLNPVVKSQVQIEVVKKRATFDLGKVQNRDTIAAKFKTQSH